MKQFFRKKMDISAYNKTFLNSKPSIYKVSKLLQQHCGTLIIFWESEICTMSEILRKVQLSAYNVFLMWWTCLSGGVGVCLDVKVWNRLNTHGISDSIVSDSRPILWVAGSVGKKTDKKKALPYQKAVLCGTEKVEETNAEQNSPRERRLFEFRISTFRFSCYLQNLKRVILETFSAGFWELQECTYGGLELGQAWSGTARQRLCQIPNEYRQTGDFAVLVLLLLTIHARASSVTLRFVVKRGHIDRYDVCSGVYVILLDEINHFSSSVFMAILQGILTVFWTRDCRLCFRRCIASRVYQT